VPGSTTDLAWTDFVSNPDLRGKRSATNCLSHDTTPLTYNINGKQ